MKIAILIDSPFDKGYIYPSRINDMAEYLVLNGHSVTVYCKKEEGLKKYEVKNGVVIKRVFDKFLGSTERIDFYLKSHIELFNSVDYDTDIYHCIDTMTLPMGVLLKDTYGGKLIFDCFEYFPDYIEKKWYGKNINKYKLTLDLLKARGAFITRADGVICPSEEMAERLFSEFNLQSKPIAIYNTTEKTFVKGKSESLMGDLNEQRIIMFQGIVEESRGIEYLFELVEKMPSYNLVLAGKIDASYKNKLDKKLKQMKLTKRVVFTGFKDRNTLLKYTRSADCLIYTPYIRVENINLTLPNKIFDYIGARKPIIVNEAISLKNLVEKTKTGISISMNGDIDENISKINSYIENYDLSQINYRSITQKYSIKNGLKKIEKLYGDLEW